MSSIGAFLVPSPQNRGYICDILPSILRTTRRINNKNERAEIIASLSYRSSCREPHPDLVLRATVSFSKRCTQFENYALGDRV